MKTLKSIKNYIIAAGLLLCGYGTVLAQVKDYTFAASYGTFTEITGGTVLKSGGNSTSPVSYMDTFLNRPIGFKFNFDGNITDWVNIRGNGFISFQPGYLCNGNGNGSYIMADANAKLHISACSGTDYRVGTVSTSEVRMETIGTAPNRKCVIQFKDLSSHSNPTTTMLTAQIILYETTNVIQFAYNNCFSNLTGYDYCFAGLKGKKGEVNARYTNGTPAPQDWTNTYPTTDIYPYLYLRVNSYPPDGLIWTWSPPPSYDFKPIALLAPFSPCGNASDTVKVLFQNFGLDSVAPGTVDVRVKLTGAISTTFNTTYANQVSGKEFVTIPVGEINTTGLGDTIRYEMVITHPSDPNRANDTLVSTVAYYTPTASITIPNQTRCGFGTSTLAGSGLGPNESVLWYNSSTSTAPIFSGASYTTPTLVPSSTPYTYYVERIQRTAAMSIGTNGTLTSWSGATMGYYMDITADAAEMLIESFVVNQWSGNKQTDVAVYIKQGTYLGFERSPLSWTKVAERLAFNTTGTQTIPAGNFIVPKGSTVGVYIIYSNAIPLVIPSYTDQVSDNRVTLNKGVRWRIHQNASGPFVGGNIFDDYAFYGTVNYRAICKSAKNPVTVTVNPRPVGSEISQSSPFEGDYRTGIQANPDITKAGDDIAYEITAPTGFTNATYGSAWNMAVTLKTLSGAVVPTSDYDVTDPGSSNGKIVVSPTSTFTDSLLKMTVAVNNITTGCDTVYVRHIFVAPVPNVDFTVTDACLGQDLLFNNITTLSSGTMTYRWDFGDTLGTSTDPGPAYRYLKAGTYTVTLIVTSNYGYSDTATKVVNVRPLPVANFTRISACLGDSVGFTNTSTNSGSFTSAWNFGDGQISNIKSPNHKYANVGNYTVKLTVTSSNGCVSTIQKSVSTFYKPVAAFTSTGTCSSSDVEFTNGSTITNGNLGYQWDFQDGAVSYDENPAHRFTVGNKSVKLKVVSEFGCADSITQNFTIQQGPTASFNAGAGCSVDSTAFVNTSTTIAGGTSYLWDFGDGRTSTAASPKHKYASLGNKTIILTVTATANGCVSKDTQDLNIRIQPKALFSASNVCEGTAVDFINNSSISNGAPLTYKWLFDDGQESSATSPSHEYTAANTYNPKLVVSTTGGCSDTATRVVKVSAIPNCNFTYSIDIGTRTVDFTSSDASGVTYRWQYGDGANSTGASTSYKYDFDGTFNVKLVAINADGCSCENTQEVVIQQLGIGQVGKLDREVNIYPNPTTGVVTITLSGTSSRPVQMSVINVVGAAIRTAEIAPSQFNGYTLDMSDLPAGVYMVKLQDGTQSTARRITITR